MATYRPTIGLEIHAELKTATKMFCNSKNDPDEDRPNVNVCPVCMGHPGTLPVVNKEAVHHVLRVGTALGSELADFTEFDRKNYFYPDLPKGYQISQYQYPLIIGGSLRGVELTRIHLEEDAARSYHGKDGSTLIDFNRAGVPLMEMVTEPVIQNQDDAVQFAKELQILLRTLKVSDANLEKGEMRFDVNVSVSSDDTLGTKVEVKNVNSFRSLERAIAYEIKRQTEILERGERVVQETRGWDDVSETTSSQRLKESSHDYRYFPDPDIPKFKLTSLEGFRKDEIEKTLPELPWQKRERLIGRGVRAEDAEILVTDPLFSAVYSAEIDVIENEKERTFATNLLLGEIRSKNPTKDEFEKLKGSLAELSALFVSGTVSSTAAKQILNVILEKGGSPTSLATELGLVQVTDLSHIEKIVDEVFAEFPKVVDELKAGKSEVIQFLVGQGMKKSKGSAKPELLREVIHKKI